MRTRPRVFEWLRERRSAQVGASTAVRYRTEFFVQANRLASTRVYRGSGAATAGSGHRRSFKPDTEALQAAPPPRSHECPSKRHVERKGLAWRSDEQLGEASDDARSRRGGVLRMSRFSTTSASIPDAVVHNRGTFSASSRAQAAAFG